MNETDNSTIDRRSFLRGAASLAALATIGAQTQAHADSPAQPRTAANAAPQSTLVFAAASGLLSPASFPTGGVGSADARIFIHGHFVPAGAASILRAVKAHYAVSANGGVVDIPVYAWATSNGHTKDASIKIPIAPGGGVLLSVEIGSPRTGEDAFYLSAGHTPGVAKLVPGTYAIVAGAPNQTGVRLSQYNGVPALVQTGANGPAPVNFEYVLVTVSAA